MADELTIDLLDDANIDDPYPLFRSMRDRDPIMWSARHHAWVITGHGELDEAFKDTRLSTERMQGFRDRLPAERLAALEQPQRVGERRERVAQLVRQHREELVLAPVGLGEVRLALAQPRLDRLAFGDVADLHRQAVAAGGDLDLHPATVLPHRRRLDPRGAAL